MSQPLRKVDRVRRKVVRTTAQKAHFDLAFARFSIASLLQEMRATAGLTQNELAAKARMSQPEVSRLESGGGTHPPALATLLRFANVCGFGLTLTAMPTRGSKRRVGKLAVLTPNQL
jgi:DNA-binding XRE family transcriptional regulator